MPHEVEYGRRMSMTPEEHAQKQLRRVGLGLLLAGIVAANVFEAVVVARQRLREANRKQWQAVSGNQGTLLIEAAVSLLESTNPSHGGGAPRSKSG
jgi:hypothetical protein